MLYLVLLLVVASLGLLIAALTTANTLWAWLSVLISVVAAGLLVLDWVRGRRRRSRAAPAADRRPEPVIHEPKQAPTPPPPVVAAPPEDPFESSFDSPDFGTPSSPEPTVTAPPAEPVTAVQALDPDVEPAEENTDATDLLVVSELSDEVVVIDERPRYHMTTCAWLSNRPVLPLPVSEARELGFTPCGLCMPDSTLAARQRARS